MPNGFVSLSEAFKREPAFEGLRKIINESDVVAEFKKIFPDLEKIAKAIKVEKKVLYLHVENPSWRSELKFRENTLVEKVNKYFKDERIYRVKFIA
jgi:hypothetical protein